MNPVIDVQAPPSDNKPELVLSCYQAQPLLQARERGERWVTSSLDLGVTQVELELDQSGVRGPQGEHLSWAQVLEVSENDSFCFALDVGGLWQIRGFSEEFQRTYQLYPTASAPALLISGFVMHRIRDTSPAHGAEAMVHAVSPVSGCVLDTATGLGYAAIEAAKTALEVVTVELDPMAQQMARSNPWSQALFTNPKIRQLIGNSFDVIDEFAAKSFDRVIHDPPAINLAGELYSEAFYEKAWRVLRKGGRLFHYIGDPKSKSGSRVTQGVVRRLKQAGFSKIVARASAFGVVAYK